MTLLLLLLALAWIAFRRPWLGLLALVFVGVMHPHGYATEFMQGFPAYLSLFIVVALSTAWQQFRQRAWPRLFWDWRIAVLFLLWGQFLLSTALGINTWAGWPRLLEVSKVIPLMLLVFVLIDTRVKLTWLLITIAISLSVVMLKGGYWAVMTGFQDRVYGPPGSQYLGNNEFAVATSMAIPLLALWFLKSDSRIMRWILAGLIALGFASALSSWSRGGLLSVSVVALVLVWHSRRKWLAVPILATGLVLVFVGLPENWFVRMQTIGSPESEGSAATRLELWRLGWEYARQHPWFGGGFGGWIYLSFPTGGHRVWHSAYVDMMVEHGFAGLLLWGSLLVGSVASLTRLGAYKRKWQASALIDHAAMLRGSLLTYMVGAAFLSIAYWELLYVLLASAIVTSQLAKRELANNTEHYMSAQRPQKVSEIFTVANMAAPTQ